jgi:four helix bundle protein
LVDWQIGRLKVCELGVGGTSQNSPTPFKANAIYERSSLPAWALDVLNVQGMSETSEQLKARTEAFAIAVVKFCDTLPNSMAARRIAQQLLDAGTSVAANYRAACRAYTNPLFISKLAIVDEEADESEFWLRIVRKIGLKSADTVNYLEQEAHELACIFGASLRTARSNARKRRKTIRERPFQRRSAGSNDS